MSIFIIKIIACLTMFLDHIKYCIPQTKGFITMNFGRMALPLFAFLITEGYTHTKDLKKYYIRLMVFAVISQIPFMYFRTLVGEYMMLNILFTLILGLMAITVWDKIDKKFISLPIVLVIIYVGELINVDYGWYGVALIFVLYLFKDRKIFMILPFIILNFALYYIKFKYIMFTNIDIILSFMFTCLPIVIILLYNGKRGAKLRYLVYWFYPIHMTVMYLINKMIIFNLSFGDSVNVLFEEIGKRYL